LTVFTVSTLSVIPRIGEQVFLGKLGGFDVAGVSLKTRRALVTMP